MTAAVQSMAYVGQTPWHGLGQRLELGLPIDAWAKAAGMDWTLKSAPVRFAVSDGNAGAATHMDESHKVLYRSDNMRPLSVVGARYQVVQPTDVLEFYRDLTEVSGFQMETAGVLKEGRKFWALARIGKEASLKGKDLVRGYLLLASSCDGTLSTTATPTSVRVVCNNTLTMAVNGAAGAIRVPHNRMFDAQDVRRQLGLAVSGWDTFIHRMKSLSERKVRAPEVEKFLLKVMCGQEGPVDPQRRLVNERALKRVHALFHGVTQFVDHERRARTRDHRLDSAWFGQGALLKERALAEALELAS
jgi:phage/plasmid-like protein (TIGR03299 family)